MEHGGEEWHRHLLFRDILRARPDVAAQYQTLKYALAAAHHADREAYTDAKADFIMHVLAEE